MYVYSWRHAWWIGGGHALDQKGEETRTGGPSVTWFFLPRFKVSRFSPVFSQTNLMIFYYSAMNSAWVRRPYKASSSSRCHQSPPSSSSSSQQKERPPSKHGHALVLVS
uniref:Uncharacterized protein n=1 Tax=Hordeum vulgare subsp. vulgare TaxID=112509 RepID=A0A8I6WZJ7_HORVV